MTLHKEDTTSDVDAVKVKEKFVGDFFSGTNFMLGLECERIRRGICSHVESI